MPDKIPVKMEVDQYRDRLHCLYSSVKTWVGARHADASFSETEVELVEERTGAYKAESLEIAVPNRTAVRLVPRGIFMVGAHGRVDVRSRLGREILVWAEPGGPHIRTRISEGGETLEQVTRPVYTDVEEGWAWADEERRGLRHLTEDVFCDSVMGALAE